MFLWLSRGTVWRSGNNPLQALFFRLQEMQQLHRMLVMSIRSIACWQLLSNTMPTGPVSHQDQLLWTMWWDVQRVQLVSNPLHQVSRPRCVEWRKLCQYLPSWDIFAVWQAELCAMPSLLQNMHRTYCWRLHWMQRCICHGKLKMLGILPLRLLLWQRSQSLPAMWLLLFNLQWR